MSSRPRSAPQKRAALARRAQITKGLPSDEGADDYVTKPFVLEELVARVRGLLHRHAPHPPGCLRVADLWLDAQGRQAWRGDRALELTAREFDLLECLMRHAGQVLTHRELLEQVWGSDSDGETKAVRVHVAHLRQKLNAAGKRNLIHAVRGVGYVLRD